LRCGSCNARYDRKEFDIEGLWRADQLPPLCKACGGALKGDVVHFNEPIPPDVANYSVEEAEKCDLMLICGTSAVVFPFANLPRIARYHSQTVIIEVNAEPTPLTVEGISDYLIQGKTGQILPQIVEKAKE
jgi:NAD-dependent deacetylase